MLAERKQFGPPVAFTIRRIAGGARLIGLAWMIVLVMVALARDAMTRPGVAWTLVGFSGFWAVVAALDQLRVRPADPWWITIGDAALAAFALVAPEVSGSSDLFYGGFPGIAVVAAAARQRFVGWMVAALLSAVTIARFRIADLSQALAELSALVTYAMLAAIVGWAVHVIYRTDDARRRAEDQQARAEEKLSWRLTCMTRFSRLWLWCREKPATRPALSPWPGDRSKSYGVGFTGRPMVTLPAWRGVSRLRRASLKKPMAAKWRSSPLETPRLKARRKRYWPPDARECLTPLNIRGPTV